MDMQEVQNISKSMTYRGAIRDVLFVFAGLSVGLNLFGVALAFGVCATLASFVELKQQHEAEQRKAYDDYLRGYMQGGADTRRKTVGR